MYICMNRFDRSIVSRHRTLTGLARSVHSSNSGLGVTAHRPMVWDNPNQKPAVGVHGGHGTRELSEVEQDAFSDAQESLGL